MEPFNLIGEKFTRLTVQRQSPKPWQRATGWICVCDCGNNIIVTTYGLRAGKTKSCGCIQKERVKGKRG